MTPSGLSLQLNGANARDLEVGNNTTDDVTEPDELDEPDEQQRCFPCDCLHGCPGSSVIPEELHVFHGFTHILLFCGFFACMALTVLACYRLRDYSKVWRSKVTTGFVLEFVQEVFAIVFMVPCMFYFQKSLRQYNDNLPAKRKEVHTQQKRVKRTYEATLEDLEKILEQLVEMSGQLAKSNFESSRRDFLRFLHFCEHNIQEEDDQQLLQSMKDFCLKWFQVFREFSLDPIQQPFNVIDEEDLQRCRLVKEVATYCIYCLEAVPLPEFALIVNTKAATVKTDIVTRRRKLPSIAPVGESLSTAEQSFKSSSWLLKPIRGRTCQLCDMSWLVFSCCGKFELEDQIFDGKWPKLINFGFGCLVILSREHLLLLSTFFAGFVLFVTMVFRWEQDLPFLALSLLAGLLLSITLHQFESVDVIVRLQWETQNISREAEAVNKKREQICNYWKQIEDVNKLWVRRSIPFLELHHEIQERIKSAFVQESIPDRSNNLDSMLTVNAMLDAIFESLGDIQTLKSLDVAETFYNEMELIRTDVFGEQTLNDFADKLAGHQVFQGPGTLARSVSDFLNTRNLDSFIAK